MITIKKVVNGQIVTVSSSRNLRGLRRACGKLIVRDVTVTRLERGEGLLQVRFENGCWCIVKFASFEVLLLTLRHWRNLYGAPLTVDDVRSGQVSYHNPALAGE